MEESLQVWDEQFQSLSERIGGHFARAEPRRRVMTYLKGLISPCERKNGWRLAEVAQESSPDGMQRLLNQALWDAQAVRDELRAYVRSSWVAMRVCSSWMRLAFSKRGAAPAV
jgi:SRSO17 transposase